MGFRVCVCVCVWERGVVVCGGMWFMVLSNGPLCANIGIFLSPTPHPPTLIVQAPSTRITREQLVKRDDLHAIAPLVTLGLDIEVMTMVRVIRRVWRRGGV